MKTLKVLGLVFTLLIVSQIGAQEITEKTKKKFGWMDADKNGTLNLSEFKEFYKEKKDKQGEPVKYELMFLGLDKDNDKSVTLQELAGKIDWKLAKQKRKAK